jgi:MFS transporter, MHS family, proline/betaine transporter
MPTFAVKSLHLPTYGGYVGGIISGVVALVGAPYVGKLADRVGCVRVMTVAATPTIVLGCPLFTILVGNPNVLNLTVFQAILLALYFGPLPARWPRCSPRTSIPLGCRCPTTLA